MQKFPIEQEVVAPIQMQIFGRRKKIWALVGIVFIIAVIFGIIYFSRNNQSRRVPIITQRLLPPTVSPTPFPFQELTIPYLRTREYKSSLENLEKVAENDSYASYLTHYDSDGFKIYGLLTIPKSDPSISSRWPAIVFMHGYIPPRDYQTLTRYMDHVDFLTRSGFVVFKIDLRGHGDSEGEAGGGYYSGDYIIDILNARAALQSASYVDAQKIGLWGHSMAGNVLLRSLAIKPDIAAVVIWAGAGYTYTDLREYGIDDDSYRPPASDSAQQRKRRDLFEKYGQFRENSPFWKQVTPTNYLSDIKGAVSLHHAVDDSVVSIRYSRNLNSLLDKTSIPHELYEYPSGGHNITGTSFTQAMEDSVKFFEKYLSRSIPDS